MEGKSSKFGKKLVLFGLRVSVFMNYRVDISHKTIFFIASFIGALWLLYQIKDVIVLIFISIICMSALSPIVKKLTKYKIPKPLAIAFSYIIILALFGGLISLLITPLISQTTNLIGNLPSTIEKVLPSVGVDKSVLQDQLTSFSRNAFSFTLTIFSNILTIISIAVLTFYLLLDRDRVFKLIIQLFPNRRERTRKLVIKIEEKLGAWMRGQLLLSLIIGSLSFLLLFIFNVPYALPLAILAGFMEVVPVIGPIISAIPAILVAYVVSPTLAIFIGLGYFAIQQAENNLIVPQVMRRAVGLNPLIIIIAVAIGGKLLGISGALLAVPITVVIQIVAEELLHMQLDMYTEEKVETQEQSSDLK